MGFLMRRSYVSRYTKVSSSFKFRCTRCGLCCSGGPNVSITVFDAVRIASFLKIEPKVFIENYTNIIIADIIPVLALKGDKDGHCLFLYRDVSGKASCAIYPARPLRCRLYPLLVEGLSFNQVYIDPKSPGVGQGFERPLPNRLIELYIEERLTHYRLLLDLLLNRGLNPVDAIYEAFHLILKRGRVVSIDEIDKLGEV